jgi:predicted dehydrogenase
VGSPAGGALRIGLVGCGRLAEVAYVSAIGLADGVRLAAVADYEPARCLRIAPGLPAYDSAGSMLGAEALDAVIIATPTGAHVDEARTAAAAGLPALIEKPPARDTAGALALTRLDPQPSIGFNRRFEPGIERLRALLEASTEPRLELEFRYRPSAWGSYTAKDDPLLDVGCHMIDLCRWLARGEVLSVRAHTVNDLEALFDLDLPQARARVACRADGRYREQIVVKAAGSRRGAWKAGERAGWKKLALRRQHMLVKSLRAQLEAFARTVRGGGGEGLASAADGAAVMRAMDAVRRSAEVEKPVEP